MFRLITLLFSFLIQVNSDCINISSQETNSFLNNTFHKDCYDYTLEADSDCCEYFIHNQQCIDTYTECIDYEKHIIKGLKTHCHSYNTTIFNLNYTDKCHDFILTLQPSCCDNIYDYNCINWYSNCIHQNNHTTTDCLTPTKYTNDFCINYTHNIDTICCYNFNNYCNKIYTWCMDNHPEHTSILDLFLKPLPGFTVGYNLFIIHDIRTIEECLQLCLDDYECSSVDYIYNLYYCYINKHVIGDIYDNNMIVLKHSSNYNSSYFERIFTMPNKHNYCNIRSTRYLGNGMCETIGGYNTPDCNYDGGDCCKETCQVDFIWICGILGFDCIDPNVLNHPSYYPSTSPSNNPSQLPTYYPIQSTYSPSISPTQSPSISPTYSPTYSPTRLPKIIPTQHPTRLPSIIPTQSPSFMPTNNVLSLKSESDVKQNKVEVLIIVIVVVTSLLIAAGIIVYFKNNRQNETLLLKQKGQHFQNPVYDTTQSKRRRSTVSDSEINYEDDTLYNEPSTMHNSYLKNGTKSIIV